MCPANSNKFFLYRGEAFLELPETKNIRMITTKIEINGWHAIERERENGGEEQF